MSTKEQTREGFVTVREAAQLVGVTPAAVYDRIKSDHLSSERSWGVIIVPRAEVDAWVRERKTQALRVLKS